MGLVWTVLRSCAATLIAGSMGLLPLAVIGQRYMGRAAVAFLAGAAILAYMLWTLQPGDGITALLPALVYNTQLIAPATAYTVTMAWSMRRLQAHYLLCDMQQRVVAASAVATKLTRE